MKRIALLVFLVFAFTAVFIGCKGVHDPSTSEKSPNNPRSTKFIETHLPAGAHEVVDQGKGWCTFKLEVAGKERQFLYRYDSYGAGTSELGYATEAITELK